MIHLVILAMKGIGLVKEVALLVRITAKHATLIVKDQIFALFANWDSIWVMTTNAQRAEATVSLAVIMELVATIIQSLLSKYSFVMIMLDIVINNSYL